MKKMKMMKMEEPKLMKRMNYMVKSAMPFEDDLYEYESQIWIV